MNTPSEPVLTPTQKVHRKTFQHMPAMAKELVQDERDGLVAVLEPWVHAGFALQMAGELERAQKLIEELKSSAKSYPEELDECEKLAEQFKAEGDMYGWNFHMGRHSGIIHADIMTRERLDTAQAEIASLNQLVSSWAQTHADDLAKLLESESGAAGLRNCLLEVMEDGLQTNVRAWRDKCILALTSTPAGKSMVAREVLELCVESLKTFTTLNSPDVMDYDKASEALHAANQELERSGL